MCFTVHGGFSEWAEWGPCNMPCGVGAQKRVRQCNNPLPANGGRHCAGPETETRSCQGKPCPGEDVCKKQSLEVFAKETVCKCHMWYQICTYIPGQSMANGQNGLSGRSVHEPVGRATKPGSGPAATLHLSTEAGRVRGRQWRSSCAESDHVLVRKHFFS